MRVIGLDVLARLKRAGFDLYALYDSQRYRLVHLPTGQVVDVSEEELYDADRAAWEGPDRDRAVLDALVRLATAKLAPERAANRDPALAGHQEES